MAEFDSGAEVAALIVDLVDSRSLPDRAAVQRQLRAALPAVAERLGPGRVVAGPSLGNGDEVQCLTRDLPGAFEAALVLADAVLPVGLTFGIGWGGLATPVESPEQPVGQLDGPCLHRARAALELSQDEGVWGRSAGIGASEEPLVVALHGTLDLLAAVRRRWTEKQGATVAAMRGDRLQKDVAEDQGVAPSTVSEQLKAADWEAVQAGERAVRCLLEEAQGRTRDGTP